MSGKNQKPVFKLDEVSEVIRLGLNAAADALSRLIGKSARFTSINSQHLALDKIERDGLPLPGIIAKLSCSGAVEGAYALIMPYRDVWALLGILMNTEETAPSLAPPELDEISFVTVRELINQMAAAFCETLTEFFGSSVTPASLEMELIDSMEEAQKAFPYKKTEHAICTTFRMGVDNVLDSGCMCCFSETFATSTQRLMVAAPQEESVPEPSKKAVSENTSSPKAQLPQTKTRQVQKTENPEISVQPTRFPVFPEQDEHSGSSLTGGNINLLMDVPLTVTIEIGKTRKKMRDIMDFTQGTVIGLEKQAGAPVDIVVNGQLIARGDVVVIDDNFGVRITEILGTKDLLDKEQSNA